MSVIPKFVRVKGRLLRVKKHDDNLSYLLPANFLNPLHWIGLTSAYLFPPSDIELHQDESGAPESNSDDA